MDNINTICRNFSVRVSNFLDSNDFKHITAEQVDKMVETIQPKFNLSQKQNKCNDICFLRKQVVVDDFGYIHGPYESDNLLVESVHSDVECESDDYDDIADLYKDDDHSSLESLFSHQNRRMSDFSKPPVPLVHATTNSTLKTLSKEETEKSFYKTEVELHKYETILEKNFLTRFDEKMYKDDILLDNSEDSADANIFIKFEYLKNIMEWNEAYIKCKSDYNKDALINHQNKNSGYPNIDKKDHSSVSSNIFINKKIRDMNSMRKQNKKSNLKRFKLKKDKSDLDDYIINNKSILSEVHSVTRKAPRRKKLVKPNKPKFSSKNLKKQKLESGIKRSISITDNTSAKRSETSIILRQKSFKRAFESNVTNSTSKDLENKKITRYKNSDSSVSLLDLYCSDNENENLSLSINNDTFGGLNSPRLLRDDFFYNPTTKPMSSESFNWRHFKYSSNSGADVHENQNNESIGLSSLPDIDTEKSTQFGNNTDSSVIKTSKSNSSLNTAFFRRWKSPSKTSTNQLNLGEFPVLYAKSKNEKNANKPLIKQLTEKLIMNKKESEIEEDQLNANLPFKSYKNEVGKRFRFFSEPTTSDADNEFNTNSSEIKQQYKLPMANSRNETSSNYELSTGSSALSSIGFKEYLQHYNHAGVDANKRSNHNINTLKTSVPKELLRSRGQHTDLYDQTKSLKEATTKTSTFRYNDPYLNLRYDQEGRRKPSENPFCNI